MPPKSSLQARILRLRSRQNNYIARLSTFSQRMRSLADEMEMAMVNDPRTVTPKGVEHLRTAVSELEDPRIRPDLNAALTSTTVLQHEKRLQAFEEWFEETRSAITASESILDAFAAGEFSCYDNGSEGGCESEISALQDHFRRLGVSEEELVRQRKILEDEGMIRPDPAAIGPYPPLRLRISRLQQKQKDYTARHQEFLAKAVTRYRYHDEVAGDKGNQKMIDLIARWTTPTFTENITARNVLREENMLLKEEEKLATAWDVLRKAENQFEARVKFSEAMSSPDTDKQRHLEEFVAVFKED
ncbi:hypothetical protein BJ508DRAFT_328442 [Ascobolus immersus RN42]|uniref:Uncharacterized protein n=1 Tax=Ascobolus immersus RN42 TaxID=1160509 RepID=A0A3N4I3W0_ASCIM|nr:hypothetical protein BJ508DRAFT_328442 [Ascobolus immersus RN42]